MVNMARLTIYKDSKNNSTSVSNRFIDEYMDGANDVQLKVYLYLLRMLGANQATSVSDLADKFNHTEREIIRALKYWEKKTLLTLDYDAGGIPVGIHFRDLDSEYEQERRIESATSQSLAMFMEPAETVPMPPQSVELMPAMQPAQTVQMAQSTQTVQTMTAQSAQPAQTMQTAQSAQTAQTMQTAQSMHAAQTMQTAQSAQAAQTTLEPQPAYEKPVYSASDVREFKNREETAQILFIAETYIGRPLTPAEMKSLLFFTDILQFSVDLIDYLIAYCVERDKKDFKYIERVAINWAENNVSTPAQAKRFSKKYDKNVYAIMNALGKPNAPTNKEAEYITRWTGEYGFDLDIILEACDRTVMATDRHRLEYAESILSSWHQENVHKKSDIRKMDELYQQKKASGTKRSGNTSQNAGDQNNNKFNQFSQNSYDFAALEKKLLSN